MKKLLLYSGLVMLILLLLVCSVSLFLAMTTGARVARERAAIQAAGDPLYLTDYARDPIADDDNAWHYLRQAKADLEAFDKQYAELGELDLTRRLRPDQVEALARLVEQYSQFSRAYEMIEKAAACSHFDAQIDYSKGIATELPHATLFRSTARALQVQSLVLAYRGDGDKALADCERMLRLAAHLQGEPLIITHLVSIACQGIAVQCSNHVLRVAETSASARERLDAAVAALDNRRASVVAFAGERAMGALTFEQMRSGKLDPNSLDNRSSPMTLVSRTWIGQAYLNDDEAKFLELMNGYIDATELNAADRQAKWDSVESEITAGGMRYTLTRLLLPALHSASAASDRGDTMNRCLRVLLAVHGRKQATLADLKLPASVTQDAAGLPLIIRQTDDGWLVYGVGVNGVDDGGKFDAESRDPPDLGLAPLVESLAPDVGEAEAIDDSVGAASP